MTKQSNNREKLNANNKTQPKCWKWSKIMQHAHFREN